MKLLIVLLLSLSIPSIARADGVGVELSVTPMDQPYLFQFSLSMSTWLGMEVVADRRLLRFDVRAAGSRRVEHCAHPAAPRFSPTLNKTSLGPAGGPAGSPQGPVTYSEWIDLRDYCTGRALAALDAGANVVPHYGFRRASRSAWVARNEESGVDAASVAELTGAAFDVAPRPPATAPTGDASVTLASVEVDTQRTLVLRVSVRATGARARRIYLRADQIRFRVRSMLGTVECGLPREERPPVADFFTRIDRRRAATLALDANVVCHDAFPLAGIYEVTPMVALPYRAPAPHDADSLVGEFVAAQPAVVRVRRGDRGYVEQNLADLPPRRPSS